MLSVGRDDTGLAVFSMFTLLDYNRHKDITYFIVLGTPQYVVPLDIVPPEGGATLGRIDTICGTWNADRGTRCSMPPKEAATLCHIDTRCSMLGYPQDIPRRGCDILSHTRCSRIICRIDTRSSTPEGVRQFDALTF